MGAQFGEVCYIDAPAAADAYCASQFPRVTQDASGVISYSCVALSGASVQIEAYSSASAVSSVVSVPVSFSVCDPMKNYTEVQDYFVAGIAALALVLVARMMFWPLTQNQ